MAVQASKIILGEVNFASIRENNIFYADKTDFLYRLAKDAPKFFLARPRRFGKSLLVSSLEHLLGGHRDLFKGLWIDGSDYDWQEYPVIKLQMQKAVADDIANMESNISAMLTGIADRAGVVTAYLEGVALDTRDELKQAVMDGRKLDKRSPAQTLGTLIERLSDKCGGQRVAVLIDEYDAPILEHLEAPATAEAFRKALSNFYGVLKTSEDKLGHIFITGVGRFAKASMFSKLNNLVDISMDQDFADICGLTYGDLERLLDERQDQVLADLIHSKTLPEGSARGDLKKLILDWYDGYSWNGETKILNPWSLLSFFGSRRLTNFWYQSGTPAFLVERIRNGQTVFDAAKMDYEISESANVIDDLSALKAHVLMFQAGYLTITKRADRPAGGPLAWHLDFPNLEVRASLAPLLFKVEPPEDPISATLHAIAALKAVLRRDKPATEAAFSAFLAQYPYQVHLSHESHCHSLLISAFRLAGRKARYEESVGGGRLDVGFTADNGEEYVIELKHLGGGRSGSKTEGRGESAPADDLRIPPGPPTDPKEKDRLLSDMAKLAKTAMSQIGDKCAKGKSRGGLVKVALVVARRTVVLAEFEESPRQAGLSDPGK